MTRQDIIFAASGIATFVGIVAASIAASGEVSPLGVSIATAVAAGTSGLVAWLAKPQA